MIDLILQGSADKYTLEIANHYLQLSFVNNIIISCWEDLHSENPRIKTIWNKPIEYAGIGNRNNQIYTSLIGLEAIETEFAVKLRSDQKISLDSMEKMNLFYQEHKERKLTYQNNGDLPYNRILVAGIFKPFPFHPRDHIFWGNTKDLMEVFNIPHDTSTFINYNSSVRSEAYIASYYYAKFDKRINEFIKNPQEFLVDNASRAKEAFDISDKLITKVFKPFPKIDLEWPKHGMTSYHYDYTEKEYGEYWSKEWKQ